jgi:hypothetical protein
MGSSSTLGWLRGPRLRNRPGMRWGAGGALTLVVADREVATYEEDTAGEIEGTEEAFTVEEVRAERLERIAKARGEIQARMQRPANGSNSSR